MIVFAINFMAICIIFLWASWCVLYRGVHDGLVGKLLWACVAVSALAIILHSLTGDFNQRPFVTMNVCIALVGARHIYLTWRKVQAELMRKNNAKHF